jgi:hypothetical protein
MIDSYVKKYSVLLFPHIRGDLVRMIWPPQSPDLNTIEAMRDNSDIRLRKTERTSEYQMGNKIQKTWNDTPKKVLRKKRGGGEWKRNGKETKKGWKNRMASRIVSWKRSEKEFEIRAEKIINKINN